MADTLHSIPTTTLPDEPAILQQEASAQSKLVQRPHSNRIFLFDVDGTLTVPRKHATDDMHVFLNKLRERAIIGIVGGSDLVKQIEQLGNNLLTTFDYVFSENGLMSYKHSKLIHQQSLVNYIGEDNLKLFINYVLHYIADLDIPIKRGTFIEFRAGMLNVSPIGRNCNQIERDEFEQYDLKHGIRKKMVEDLTQHFSNNNVLNKLKYSIGGQISFDVFPVGWDKTYCIQFLERDNYNKIYFFGDKTYKGGNDYEIYNDSRVNGNTVKTPEDTIRLVKEILQKEDGITL